MIRRRSLLAGSLALPVLSACSSKDDAPAVTVHGVEDHGYYGTFLEEGMPLPDVELIDQNGQPYNLRTGWKTKAVALFFGYLNCPDVCPGIMADMALARRRMEGDLSGEVTPILVTTDPARDTPEALKAYLERVDDSFVGLTGELELIMDVGNQLGIAIEKGKQLPSGGYEVDHSTQVLGVAEDREVHVIWTTLGLEVGNLREDYTKLVAL